LPLSEDEEEEEEDDGEEVPPPEEEEAEADPDNTYIPVIRLRRQIDVSEMWAFAKIALESDYRIEGKALLATFVALIAFLMLVVSRTC